VIPFAICFRILITFAYNRTRFSVLIAAITHASFNEASEIISQTCRDPWPRFSRSPQSDC
jgi:membrane protease YdiL (CAAX protease family)